MGSGHAGAATMKDAILAVLPRLRRFCHAMAGNAADGDDLMQSTVERALAHGDQFQRGTRIDSWLYRIAQNLQIDLARAKGRRGTAVPVEDAFGLVGDDGEGVFHRAELAAVSRALADVPEDQRAAFLLVVVEGLSYREAADALDVPVGTIMSRIARARGRIDKALGRAGGTMQ